MPNTNFHSIPTGSAQGPSARRTAAETQILTVNVEDYFQAGVFHRYVTPRNWYRFESRLERNTELTLSLLAEHGTRATFFILGWVAEKFPALVQRIADAGHEIASRGHLHQPLLRLSREARKEDLRRSKFVLEDIIGREVTGFRLSDGWLTRRSLAFLDEVQQAGYRYDSSLMPRRRDFVFQPERRLIHPHECEHGQILEVPPSTLPVAGIWLPIAGGNYLRQLPEERMRSFVETWVEREPSPYVMYFQVWELDPDQPRLNVAGRLAKLRHYRNLDRWQRMLPGYLQSLNFTSIEDHSRLMFSRLKSLAGPESTPVTERRKVPSTPPRIAALQFGTFCGRAATPVTLVIPCYNEETSLPYLYRTLLPLRHSLSAHWRLKVLFVDDCSQDNTHAVLQSLFADDPDVRIIRHDRNKGVSAAIMTGIESADTEIVASMDCDCSYDPNELRFMLPLLKPGVAMVTASPYHPQGRVSNVPRWRLTLSHGLSRIYQKLLNSELSTWTSCFRVYRKWLIQDLPLREPGFLGTAELAAHLSLSGREIVEHPATLEVRLFGFSKMNTLKTIGSHLRLLLQVAAEKRQAVSQSIAGR